MTDKQLISGWKRTKSIIPIPTSIVRQKTGQAAASNTDSNIWQKILRDYPDINHATIPPTLRNAAIRASRSGIGFNLHEALRDKTRGVSVPVSGRFLGFENAMKGILESIFGAKLLEELRRQGINPRSIYEIGTPTTQCRAVIGAVDEKTTCWICGLRIQDEPGQCEHVLPIAQAVMFLGLYSQERGWEKGGDYNPRTDPVLQLEYKYAHETCNMFKNDTVLIGTARQNTWPYERFGTYGTVIRNLLHSIWTKEPGFKHASYFREFLHSSYGGDRDRFISERTAAMKEHLQKITNYLNSATAPGLVKLIATANLIGGPMRRDAALLLKDAETAPKRVDPKIFYEAMILILERKFGGKQTDMRWWLSYYLRNVAEEVYSSLLSFITTTEGQDMYGWPVQKLLLTKMIVVVEEEIAKPSEYSNTNPRLLASYLKKLRNILSEYSKVPDLPEPTPIPAIGGAGTAVAPVPVESVEKDTVMDVIQSMITLNKSASEAVASEEERLKAMLVEELMALKGMPVEDNTNYAASLLRELGRNTAGGFRKTRKKRAGRRRRTVRH